MARTRIGIIGDYKPDYLYHLATNSALEQAAARLGAELTCRWVSTGSIARMGADAVDDFDGLWASPGSPYESMEGALAGIRFAREKGKPFVGT